MGGACGAPCLEALGLKKPNPLSSTEDPDDLAESIFSDQLGTLNHAQKANLIRKHGSAITDAQIQKMTKDARQFMAKYELGKTLSSGQQGVTHLATERSTGQKVVVKKPNDVADTADFDALVGKSHPNVVRVFECFHSMMDTFIVMECCAGGDLFEGIESMQGGITQNWCAKLFLQVIKGVHYIHTQFAESHNDIKPENILLESKPRSSEDRPRAMIGDFGCIAEMGTVNQDTGGGDPRYRAPEIYQGATFGAESDVWACGITLFELVSGGNLPYINQPNIGGWKQFQDYQYGILWNQYYSYLLSGYPPDLSMFSQYRRLPDILGKFLDARPNSRITLSEAFEHPWFQLAESGAPQAPLGEEALERLQTRAQKNALHAFLLDMIGRRLQGESLNYYREIWDQYDVDNDGTLDFQEFQQMVDENGLTSDTNSAEQMFELADINNEGFVNFNEFVGLMFNPDELEEEEKMKYFASVFNEIAGDDGLIQFEELAAEFPQVNRNEVRRFFDILDEDHNGEIDIDEFRDYLSQI